MNCADCHETSDQEREADDKTQDVLVVAGEPGSGCRDYKEQSELCRNTRIRRGKEKVEHGTLWQTSFASLDRNGHPVLLWWESA